MWTKMWWENSFEKIVWLKNTILPFFLPKIRTTSSLRHNTALIIFINRQITQIKSSSQYLLFTEKSVNKNVAFLNVLSVYILNWSSGIDSEWSECFQILCFLIKRNNHIPESSFPIIDPFFQAASRLTMRVNHYIAGCTPILQESLKINKSNIM